ncbi:LPS export ABC transporter periplasmic protein LptC [Desulfosudis oleivorans]|uniref:LPS export ABC transporter periplasmic protein LptC n=1 Tax=Desulfosudis oleivorans (strain DSM 6200 / JCM 39069 / Hxd3) TaxID=96561 RepID=A8ZU07_DESOH|nr:LPS export ABC transporter periplasmic protein LptC [Desulfosudis oleivorans]ABW66319.1 protein of unknown function DUF1239 [Desulfosudis oleivorans Hxd3]
MRYTRPISLFLMITVFAALGAVIYLLVQSRPLSVPPAATEQADTGVDISMTGVSQTFVQEGRISHTLTADTASLLARDKKAVFENVTLTFLAEDGTPSVVTAKQGELSTETGDATLSGGVVVENRARKIYAQTLHYNDNRHILYSVEPVVVTGDSFRFTGNSMTFDMTSGKAVLSGNVTGRITDDALALQ